MPGAGRQVEFMTLPPSVEGDNDVIHKGTKQIFCLAPLCVMLLLLDTYVRHLDLYSLIKNISLV